MMTPKLNYWQYRIYKDAFDGQRQHVATYISATNNDSVAADLSSRDSYLVDYLHRVLRIDSTAFLAAHALRSQALLGGLHANRHAALRFGMWIGLTAPPAAVILPPGDLGKPDCEGNGVMLWAREVGETEQDA